MAMVTSNQTSLLGELFLVREQPNTLTRLLGGIQGGIVETSATEYPTGVYYTLPAGSQANAVLEGAPAPAPQNLTISQSTNNLQLFAKTVSISYLAMGNKTVGGIVPIPQAEANGPVINPRDVSFQVEGALGSLARDLNVSLLTGVQANPADPSATVLKTRGLLTGLTTNVQDHSADTNVNAATYRSYINGLLSSMIQQNGYNLSNKFALLAGVNEFSNICAAFEGGATQFVSPEQTIFGVQCRTIVSRFGTCVLAVEPDMPANTVVIANLGVCGIVGMPVPGKGMVVMEPLAKVGPSEQMLIYAQLGGDFGPEYYHGLFKVPAGLSL